MKRLGLLVCVGAAGCPNGPPTNPPTLFLAPFNMETEVQLVPNDPPPY